MDPQALHAALAAVPPGRFAVGVSGGADSVALLMLLRQRADLTLHVVHLDHETRGQDSTADSHFVQDLAAQWRLPCTIARRSQLEPTLPDLPANPSARYRAVRMALFRQIVATHTLDGVVLAHHADDQAETVLHRLLRGSSFSGLSAMSPRAVIQGLPVLRPLLNIPRQQLREFLLAHHQPWREDASNACPKYFRNRLRRLLTAHPQLSNDLLSLADACRALRHWTHQSAPTLPARFDISALRALPPILACESARRWLRDQGVPPDELLPDVVQRLLNMANDAASSPRRHFPNRLLVRRRGGQIFAE